MVKTGMDSSIWCRSKWEGWGLWGGGLESPKHLPLALVLGDATRNANLAARLRKCFLATTYPPLSCNPRCTLRTFGLSGRRGSRRRITWSTRSSALPPGTLPLPHPNPAACGIENHQHMGRKWEGGPGGPGGCGYVCIKANAPKRPGRLKPPNERAASSIPASK